MATPKLTTAQRLAINYYKAKLNLMHALSPHWAATEVFDLFTRPYGKPRRRSTKGFMQKAEPLALYNDIGKIAGYRWRASPANDRRILIVHGFAGSVGSFERYISPLTKAGFDVYAYEAPGHGQSAGTRLNVRIYSNVLEQIISTHGPFEGYLAHSLGGLSLMLTLHQVAPAPLPKVVLLAPATESTTAADKFFEFLQLPQKMRHAFEQHIVKVGGQPLEWYSISRVLLHTQARILWLHDEEDTTTPIGDVYPLLQQQPAHVHFYFTKGLGHSGIYKDNKVKKKIISFLTGLPENYRAPHHDNNPQD